MPNNTLIAAVGCIVGVVGVIGVVGCAAAQSPSPPREVARDRLPCGADSPEALCALARELTLEAPAPWKVELRERVIAISREAMLVSQEISPDGAPQPHQGQTGILVTIAEQRLPRREWRDAHEVWQRLSARIERLSRRAIAAGASCTGKPSFRFCPRTKGQDALVADIAKLEGERARLRRTPSVLSGAYIGDFFPVSLSSGNGCDVAIADEATLRSLRKLELLVLSKLEPYEGRVTPSFARPDQTCRLPFRRPHRR